jgi:hypothetical protein
LMARGNERRANPLIRAEGRGGTGLPREVTDSEGIAWTCIQAFAGLGKDPDKIEAARVDGEVDRYDVVCTPSGGAKSVRIQLPGDWETSVSDETLVGFIRGGLEA